MSNLTTLQLIEGFTPESSPVFYSSNIQLELQSYQAATCTCLPPNQINTKVEKKKIDGTGTFKGTLLANFFLKILIYQVHIGKRLQLHRNHLLDFGMARHKARQIWAGREGA